MSHAESRTVQARLLLEVTDRADIIVQLATATDPALALDERLTVTGPNGELTPAVVTMTDGGRAHRFTADSTRLEIDYTATVTGRAAPAVVSEADSIRYLRPSRYAESDRLVATASREFGDLTDHRSLLTAVTSWVGTRITYLAGVSRPTDGAVQTLLSREGVCRDFAHLVIALLRARDVPARMVAVYAPGLSPMDFHAVAEVAIDGRWCVVDATALAPRSSLVRIATGRDASDTAFLSTYGGEVTLLDTTVSAVVSGSLPSDNMDELAYLG